MIAPRFDRRALLRLGASGGAVAAGATALPLLLPNGQAAPSHAGHAATRPQTQDQPADHNGHNPSSTVGDVDVERLGWDPSVFVSHFDYGEATTMADGTVVREWEIVAFDREIEIAPGVFFPAWTYNGTVPGPTLRANEGELMRVHFRNGSPHPHTIHFHGIHSSFHDGVTGIGRGDIEPGGTHVYELKAAPFGVHLYHC